MKAPPMFRLCAYWGMWSRVLTEGRPSALYMQALRMAASTSGPTVCPAAQWGGLLRMGLVNRAGLVTQLGLAVLHGPTVELNLTPIRSRWFDHKEWLTDVAGMHIRAHCTSSDQSDIITYELPSVVRAAMQAHLDPLQIDKLLTTDFLPLIDWEKYEQVNNGGADLSDCFRLSSRAAVIV